ncbi:MAG: YigZ family protein [Candidatus Woesearchaeota archaeon]
MRYKSVSKNSESKLIINKSHFYGYVFPINNSDEIKNILSNIKKQHKGCNHVAYAFKVGSEENYSDDGEPNKTAGMPLFNIIKYNNLDRILICVARIFGGVKLGVSGLITAYGDAGREALSNNEIVEKEETKEVVKEIPINEFSKVEKELKKNKIEYSVEFKVDRVIVKMKEKL